VLTVGFELLLGAGGCLIVLGVVIMSIDSCYGKCKVIPHHTFRAHRGSRGVAPLVLNVGTT
jgi:hypothetical protein